MSDDSQISALERLTKLRESGALTEGEFTAQKAAILATSASIPSHVPFYRRLWVVVTLTCLILTFWVSLIILATGDVYRRAKGGSLTPIKRTTRRVYAGLLALWVIGLVVKAVIDPSSLNQEWANSAPAQSTAESASPNKQVSVASRAPAVAPPQSPAIVPAPAPIPPPGPTAGAPNMQVQSSQTAIGKVMTVTGDDDSAFTIQRVIINGRQNEKGCDFPKFAPEENDMDYQGATPLPATLKRGEQAAFGTGCGEILSVDIYTDRGTSQFKFNQN